MSSSLAPVRVMGHPSSVVDSQPGIAVCALPTEAPKRRLLVLGTMRLLQAALACTISNEAGTESSADEIPLLLLRTSSACSKPFSSDVCTLGVDQCGFTEEMWALLHSYSLLLCLTSLPCVVLLSLSVKVQRLSGLDKNRVLSGKALA